MKIVTKLVYTENTDLKQKKIENTKKLRRKPKKERSKVEVHRDEIILL